MPTAGHVVKHLLDALRDGDLPATRAAFDDQCVIRASSALPWGGERTGKDGFTAMVRTMARLFAARINDYEIFTEQDVAVVRAHVTFTSRASGESTLMPITEIYRIRGHHVTELDVYYKDPHIIAGLASLAPQ